MHVNVCIMYVCMQLPYLSYGILSVIYQVYSRYIDYYHYCYFFFNVLSLSIYLSICIYRDMYISITGIQGGGGGGMAGGWRKQS